MGLGIFGDQSAYLYLVRNVPPLHGTSNLFAAGDDKRTICPVVTERAHQDLAHLGLGPAVDVEVAEEGVVGGEADAVAVAYEVAGGNLVDDGEDEMDVHGCESAGQLGE